MRPTTQGVSGGAGMKPMEELLRQFEEKLEGIHRMIAEYDETMDYASQCALQGFAEGLGYAVEEVRERLNKEETPEP
jgi:hypothetical protein